LTLGAVQGTASAALTDTDPDGNKPRAALVSSLAVVGGSAAGPLLGGVLAQYAPAPRVLPYLVDIALLGVALAALLRLLPADAPTGRTWRPSRPDVPAQIRRTFTVASISAFLAWAVTALYLALMPSYVTQIAGTQNLALAGGIVALMLGCAAVVQIPLRRLATLRAQTIGLSLLILGLGGIIAAARTGSLTVVVAATVITGLGQGLAFGASLAEVNAVAPTDRRGDIMSSYYVVIYIGVALPVIGVGLIALGPGLLVAVQIFAVIVAAAAIAGLVAQRVDARRPDRLSPAQPR
jgi:MFS family permease